MDIREIQRLHAQFAPDSMVIDLPRQIAALPGPADLSRSEPARATGGRFTALAPRARLAAIALAVAGMVGMAGMGAASLYTNVKARHYAASTAAPEPSVASRKGDELIAAAGKPEVPAYREVDATLPHPVSAAPALSASDFASARSLGLTADQFRDSLKAPTRSAQAATPGTAPVLTGAAQLAAASPIHRAGASRETAAVAQPLVTPVQAAPTQPVAALKPAVPAQSAAQPAPGPQAPLAAAQVPAPAAQAAQPGAATQQQPAEAVKPAHAARHHISRPRAEQNAESNTDARPSADTRAGSAEVKMF
ncbi:hypothetical protein [Paraburkholderia sp. RL17-337-BIB-A]|uniref:hypothetical protein n=1 Tax=Paraburkholderia sp. RL17-337-BIB-A TaxID=3031636 RepID=UPI0038B9D228